MGHRKDREAYNSYMREYNRNKPEKRRNYDLKRFFGITLDEYNRLYDLQGGVCAICGNPESALNARTREPRLLAVDHCHNSGKVRGLLCSCCNTAIGLLKDDPKLVVSTLEYLAGGLK